MFNEVTGRVVRAGRADLYSIPAGQVVGAMTEETIVREATYAMQTELADTLERMAGIEYGG